MPTESHTDPDHHAYGVRGRVVQASDCGSENAGSNPVARPPAWKQIEEEIDAEIIDALLEGREPFTEPAGGDAGGPQYDCASVAQAVERKL